MHISNLYIMSWSHIIIVCFVRKADIIMFSCICIMGQNTQILFLFIIIIEIFYNYFFMTFYICHSVSQFVKAIKRRRYLRCVWKFIQYKDFHTAIKMIHQQIISRVARPIFSIVKWLFYNSRYGFMKKRYASFFSFFSPFSLSSRLASIARYIGRRFEYSRPSYDQQSNGFIAGASLLLAYPYVSLTLPAPTIGIAHAEHVAARY